MHNKLQIIYKNNKPHGIRDESGYLFFFTEVSKFPNQEERYRQEVQEQCDLVDYLLSALQARRAQDASTQPSAEADGDCLHTNTARVWGIGLHCVDCGEDV